ncbi:MAG: WHG domain-containing protein [Rhodovibrionaceae bacterium]|nr:WHG domain-containing protein [Rhodovibrionaceae bacterium]
MARRADHSPEELRELILETAADLAREGGLRAIAMRRIGERIGYSPGSIYNALGDLDDVILHLNGRTLLHLTHRLEVAVGGLSDPRQRAMALTDAYLSVARDERALWSILFEYSLPPDRELPQWYADAMARPVEVVAQSLGPIFADETEAHRSVAALWAALHGVASLATSGKLRLVSEEDPNALARALVARYLGFEPPGT